MTIGNWTRLASICLHNRRAGNTTAIIKGLEAVGGGIVVVPNVASVPRVPEGSNIKVKSLGNIKGLVNWGVPILLDPSAVGTLAKDVQLERNRIYEEIDRLLDLIQLNRISTFEAKDRLKNAIYEEDLVSKL
jgi:hypothetical protein